MLRQNVKTKWKSRDRSDRCIRNPKRTSRRILQKGLVILALFLCLFSATVTVFAEPGDELPAEYTETYVPDGTSSANDGMGIIEEYTNTGSEVTTQETVPADISSVTDVTPPSGNLTLLEDVISTVNGNREFLTVYSNDGHYFYIIIDRDQAGTGNVYFLNMVDDSDLYALTEKNSGGTTGLSGGLEKDVCICTGHCTEENINENCPVCSKNYKACEGTVTEKTEEKVQAETSSSPFGLTGWKKTALYAGIVVAVAAVILIVAINRKKKQKKGGVKEIEINDDDEEYDDEEE